MFALELSNDDKKWLQGKYPDLTITKEDGIQVVSEELHFDAIYQDLDSTTKCNSG